MEDPGSPLDPAVLAASTPEEQRNYAAHRLLDGRLHQAFGELAAQVDRQALDSENFRERLTRQLAAAEQPGAKGRLALGPGWLSGRFRSWFDFTAAAPYRWAPALVLLILLPALPVLLEVGREKESAPAEDVAVAPAGELASRGVPEGRPTPSRAPRPRRRAARADPKPRAGLPVSEKEDPMLGLPPYGRRESADKRAEAPAPAAETAKARGAAKQKESLPQDAAKSSAPAEDEGALEAALSKARTKEAKIGILRKLQALHQRKGAGAKQKATESRLRALQQ